MASADAVWLMSAAACDQVTRLPSRAKFAPKSRRSKDLDGPRRKVSVLLPAACIDPASSLPRQFQQSITNSPSIAEKCVSPVGEWPPAPNAEKKGPMRCSTAPRCKIWSNADLETTTIPTSLPVQNLRVQLSSFKIDVIAVCSPATALGATLAFQASAPA